MYLNFHYCFTSLIRTEGDEGSLTSIKKLQETMLSVLNSPATPPNLFNYGSLQRMLPNPGENSCCALTCTRKARNLLPMITAMRIIHHHDSACPWHLHGVCKGVEGQGPKESSEPCGKHGLHLSCAPWLGDIIA